MFEAWKVASGCVEALVTSPVEGSSAVGEGAVAVPSPNTPAFVGYFQYEYWPPPLGS
jgi:hypothetical protein